jgi:nickel transport protein
MAFFPRTTLFLLVLISGSLALPLPCLAHALKIFATAEGQTINGSVYFRRGAPLADIQVHAYDPDGKLLLTASTDTGGRFTMEASRHRELRLVAKTLEGHRAEFILPVAQPAPAPETGNLPEEISREGRPALRMSPDEEALTLVVERAVARQLLPLQEQLDRYGQRLRFQDIVAGLGYILGIAGVALYWAARKQLGKKEGRDQQKTTAARG